METILICIGCIIVAWILLKIFIGFVVLAGAGFLCQYSKLTDSDSTGETDSKQHDSKSRGGGTPTISRPSAIGHGSPDNLQNSSHTIASNPEFHLSADSRNSYGERRNGILRNRIPDTLENLYRSRDHYRRPVYSRWPERNRNRSEREFQHRSLDMDHAA